MTNYTKLDKLVSVLCPDIGNPMDPGAEHSRNHARAAILDAFPHLGAEDDDLGLSVQAALDEVARQDAKWGANRVQPLGVWLAILMEEVGEIAEACLDLDRTKGAERAEVVRNHEREWVQVAAVALQRVKAIRRAERLLVSGQ